MRGMLIALLFVVSGCGAHGASETPAGRSDTRQQPSNYTPGIHVSGHVNVGVVRNF